MRLHFICTGNIFRSRLAEALIKSLLPADSDIIVTSSGVMASRDPWGPIGWFTRQVLQENDLLDYSSAHWNQTSASLLSAQDFIVFMQPFHFQYCRDNFAYTGNNHQVWDIPDITPQMTDNELLDITRKTLMDLGDPINHLLRKLPPTD